MKNSATITEDGSREIRKALISLQESEEMMFSHSVDYDQVGWLINRIPEGGGDIDLREIVENNLLDVLVKQIENHITRMLTSATAHNSGGSFDVFLELASLSETMKSP